MTKIRKVKRRKRFQASINRKRLRNKLSKLPKIECKQIKDAWELRKSMQSNLKEMGLVYNPNESIKKQNSKFKTFKGPLNEILSTSKFNKGDSEQKVPSRAYVVENLEKEAKAPREKRFRLPKGQVQFITYMMDKYGDDYKAMMRDKKNYEQLTWRQMRAKINTFKKIPEQYGEYLLEKGEIILTDPTPLEVTKKQKAAENFQVHCVSRKPKKEISNTILGWKEESIESIENSGNVVTANVISSLDEEVEKVSKNKQKCAITEASNGLLQSKSKKSKSETDIPMKRKTECQDHSKRAKRLESSDGESEELDGEGDNSEFMDLSDLSNEELSDDNILDDAEFVIDSEDGSD